MKGDGPSDSLQLYDYPGKIGIEREGTEEFN